MKKHIAVLKGGLSNERDVSLSTAKGVSEALKKLGYQVTDIDVGHDLAAQLASVKPDIAFNALHGSYGEDGCVQGLLEIMCIPYTHSGVLASAMAMDKPIAKKLFESEGIPCAKDVICTWKEAVSIDPMSRPYVLKPIADGSSVGVYIVYEGETVDAHAMPDDAMMLVEEYIEGRELTVGVLNDTVMGIIEITPKEGFYDYRNKYTANMTEYLIPAPITVELQKEVESYALKAHGLLGCRGVSRSDFRLSADNKLYILETNTHPGMTPTSLVPQMAKNSGMSFENLIEILVEQACLDNR